MKAIKDSAIYLFGELISKSVPFLLLPYLSRKLGVEGYGELSYYQTYLALFLIVVGLSQDGAVARYFYFYGKRGLNLVLKTGYTYSIFVGSVILAVCFWLQSEILVYLALSAIFQSFLNVQLSLRQCQKKALDYAVIQFLLAFFSTLFTVILLEIFDTALVEKRILAILLSYVLVFILSYALYRQKVRIRSFNWQQYKTALLYLSAFGVPLIFHNVSLFLRGQLDRIFIFHQFNQAELGLYAMGAQIAAILMIVLQAINKALVPYLFEGLKQQRIRLTHIHRWALYSLLLVPVPAVVMWLIPESVLTWLLGAQFVGTKYYVLLFLLSTTLIIPYLILVNYLFYYGKNKLISLCSIFSTLVYVLSLVLLSQTRIEFVPYASIIGAISILPILYFMTARLEK
ncbi:oligosaccharide flippase family protein [[Haemophilus] felis]|uniref:Flippase n=1 Tax=[Haemophilus] felis TaxID=123822 RepID=A0A1T0B7W9_9PAST|nr:oligosaccharide flippase family protein [[Haemophilus] felis]NBI40761.1 oligosaccharide flippase family protein [[Haemophilus] felis]NBI42825.1 oligosaccharide flippase family protein [[Haemophilus] felis]OOS06227.1 flippase [[Haemophilus] felis]